MDIEKFHHYNFDSKPCEIIEFYLKNRRQYTRLEGIDSDIITTNVDVPQGLVLGPILILIFISNISNLVPVRFNPFCKGYSKVNL